MRLVIAMIVARAVVAAGAADAQDAAKQDAAKQDAPGGEAPDFPGLGEIMALQQMRHIKLWFAGSAANWPLANYEIGELKEGFDDATKLLGGDIVRQHVGAPMTELEKSIDSKDGVAFAAAFDKLSAGCNACHRTLDHGFIVIQRPQLLPYSNQNFAPQQ
jgi:hypothetical protein